MAKKKTWSMEASIYTALRRAYRSSPAMKECMDSGKEEFFIDCKNGNKLRRVRYQCVDCLKWFSKKEGKKTLIFADHIEPVVDPIDGNKLPSGERDWNKQIKRLFVDAKGLQRLCRLCHNRKSSVENAVRREQRKKSK